MASQLTRRIRLNAAQRLPLVSSLRLESLEDRHLLAVVPEMVKDINLLGANSYPQEIVEVGLAIFFTANDGTSGEELWKSDGSEAGTVRVKDIRSGRAGSDIENLTNVGGTLYFSANDGTRGYELWKSDGTEAGTVRVKDIHPGGYYTDDNSSYPRSLTNVGGTLFFVATDGMSGVELWKSDGSEAGTVRIKDIDPGTNGSYPSSLTNVGGTLYFRANDGTSGYELWKSDGSEAGTVRVKDINPGINNAFPSSLTNVGGTLFFVATDGMSGVELWKSDGSEAGTVRIKDIRSGSAGSYPSPLTNVGGTLYFSARDDTSGFELWKSDGSDTGTVRVKDINPGTNSAAPRFLTNVSGTLYFRAYDGTSGFELWKSDGSETGTVRVKDIRPGSYPSGEYLNLGPRSLTNVGGTLYFSANDGTSGYELWKSDGTDAGTVRVEDIRPGEIGSSPEGLTNVGGTLYFSAHDGMSGSELWILRPDVLVPGDLNADGTVDAGDAGIMFGNWGQSGVGDLNLDGIVDAADAGVLFANWTGDDAPTGLFKNAPVPVAAASPASRAMARRLRARHIDAVMTENSESSDLPSLLDGLGRFLRHGRSPTRSRVTRRTV